MDGTIAVLLIVPPYGLGARVVLPGASFTGFQGHLAKPSKTGV